MLLGVYGFKVLGFWGPRFFDNSFLILGVLLVGS